MDSCPPYFSQDELEEIFMTNFNRHYNSNRAPMGLYFHATWFKNKKNRRAFRKFLAEMVERPDVYIVSTWEVIQWMQNPTPQSSVCTWCPNKFWTIFRKFVKDWLHFSQLGTKNF